MSLRTPYTLKVILPVIGWGFLCSFFSYTLILTVGSLGSTPANDFFFAATPLFLLVLAVFFFLRYGFGLFYAKEVGIINKNVSNGRKLNPDLSKEEIKETLRSLVSFCRNVYLFSFASGLLVLAFSTLGISLKGGGWSGLILVLISGLTGLFFFVPFSLFFSQHVVFPLVKESRELLFRRRESVEDIILSSVKSKFFFLFLFPFFAVLVVMVCVYPIDYKTIVLALIGLAMALIIGRVLYVYVYRSFSEMDRFSRALDREEKSVFAVGSLDKEFVDLGNNFNKLSEELFLIKKDSEESKRELQKRVAELEKFFNLTVERELKMVELKKKLKECTKEQPSKTA
jgi:MFS family permease